jgi:hypothetical protein
VAGQPGSSVRLEGRRSALRERRFLKKPTRPNLEFFRVWPPRRYGPFALGSPFFGPRVRRKDDSSDYLRVRHDFGQTLLSTSPACETSSLLLGEGKPAAVFIRFLALTTHHSTSQLRMLSIRAFALGYESRRADFSINRTDASHEP